MTQEEERARRLLQINAELAKRGLKPLVAVGDADQFGLEILGIRAIYDHSRRYYVDVKFDVRFVGGRLGEYTVTFGPEGAECDGAVFVVMAGEAFVIVKQWRPTLGRWTHEIPRGFGGRETPIFEGKPRPVAVEELPMAILSRELSEDVIRDPCTFLAAHYLGRIAENSGRSAVEHEYFLIALATHEGIARRLRGSEHLKTLLWDAATLTDEIGARISDAHSITALSLARNYVRRRSSILLL